MKGDEGSWASRITLTLGLAIAMPRLFVPSASAYPVTGGAKVTIGDAIWSSQGCPTATASPQTIPKLTGCATRSLQMHRRVRIGSVVTILGFPERVA